MAKEYLNLLAKREYKVVLGPRFVNLWLLVIVLVATFISISFSNGSMRYLSDKMNDPFTNWLNIEKEEDEHEIESFKQLYNELSNEDLRQHYKISEVQGDNYYSYSLFTANRKDRHYLDWRFFEKMDAPIIDAILDEDNVIENCVIPKDLLKNNSLGIIITKDILLRLGYSLDSIPAFIYFQSNSEGADTLGIDLVEGKFSPVPVPLLGVVRRLPMNKDVIGTQCFYEKYNGGNWALSISKDYIEKMLYFVEGDVENANNFVNYIRTLLPESHSQTIIRIWETGNDERTIISHLEPWKKGSFVRIYHLPLSECISLDRKIKNSLKGNQVIRLYDYNMQDFPIHDRRCLSVNFTSLDSIRAFENYAKTNFGIQVDMTQVASKENFNAVSVMANILSWAMIVFALICIIMFVVNMLQSYFQKVKRNMGTFKAFGINSSELINVYVLILLAMIFSAVCVALGITWLIELLLPLFGLLKDGEFNYLYLWNSKTMWAIVVIVVATIATVHIVMTRLLRQTPGDLIYDR